MPHYSNEIAQATHPMDSEQVAVLRVLAHTEIDCEMGKKVRRNDPKDLAAVCRVLDHDDLRSLLKKKINCEEWDLLLALVASERPVMKKNMSNT